MQNENNVQPVPMMEQEAVNVTPEGLLAQIVALIGPEFVIIPTAGWQAVVKTIQSSEDKDLAQHLEDLRVPVIPVSLAPVKEESRILTPNGMPAGESRIILP